MSDQNPISAEIDFNAEGKQLGYLRLPYSVHRSAYGWLPMPIAQVRRGTGPKVLVMAGNHGDEYEGQVLISRLIQEVEPDMVSGQLILLPMANFPAAEAGLRTSPLDQGNLNRSFPGQPQGTPTQIIAHYIETVLLAGADYLLDLHSGGSSLLYLPSALASDGETPAEKERVRELLDAFGLPNALIHEWNEPGYFSTSAVRRQGGIGITTELGGAGMITPEILALAEHGVRHLLGNMGVLRGPLVPEAPPGEVRLLEVDNATHYLYASEPGLFEPLVELGERVAAGQPGARIHFPETPGKAPVTEHFEGSGIVVCKRVPAKSRRGDCLFHLADG
ncbi:MAG: succinylglutamate desuccinylase/aspartoacylase family protein [Pseudomonadota bacterium]